MTRERGLPIGALIVIAIGVVLLLQNLGILAWSLWAQAWRLWPVILIVIGINVLIGRRYPLMAGVLVLAIVLASIGWLVSGAQGVTDAHALEFFNPRGSAQSLNVDVDFGASVVRVSALPAGGDQIWQGRFEVPGGADMDVDYSSTGETGQLKVSPASGFFPFLGGKSEWTLRFSPDVGLALNVDGGAGDLELDLRDLRLASLDMNIGASDATIQLPSVPGTIKVSIDGGASNVDIRVPEDVAARIKSDGGLSSLNVASRFKQSGDVYISDGYDTAERKADISLSTGVASITVR